MTQLYEHYTAGDIFGEINALVEEIEMAPAEKPNTIVVPDALLDEYVETLLDEIVKSYHIPRKYLLGRTLEDKDAQTIRQVLGV